MFDLANQPARTHSSRSVIGVLISLIFVFIFTSVALRISNLSSSQFSRLRRFSFIMATARTRLASRFAARLVLRRFDIEHRLIEVVFNDSLDQVTYERCRMDMHRSRLLLQEFDGPLVQPERLIERSIANLPPDALDAGKAKRDLDPRTLDREAGLLDAEDFSDLCGVLALREEGRDF